MLSRLAVTAVNRTALRALSSGPSHVASTGDVVDGNVCSKLCVIGGGKMAEAILNALRTRNIQLMNDIVIVDQNEERLKYIQKEYSVVISKDASSSARDAEMVILAGENKQPVRPCAHDAPPHCERRTDWHGLLLLVDCSQDLPPLAPGSETAEREDRGREPGRQLAGRHAAGVYHGRRHDRRAQVGV